MLRNRGRATLFGSSAPFVVRLKSRQSRGIQSFRDCPKCAKSWQVQTTRAFGGSYVAKSWQGHTFCKSVNSHRDGGGWVFAFSPQRRACFGSDIALPPQSRSRFGSGFLPKCRETQNCRHFLDPKPLLCLDKSQQSQGWRGLVSRNAKLSALSGSEADVVS